jgi:hypothetical protein
VGRGGNGGSGGNGGRGGHGGGGAGGWSYALYRYNTAVDTDGNSLIKDSAGSGGTSQGNDGAAGVSEQTNP